MHPRREERDHKHLARVERAGLSNGPPERYSLPDMLTVDADRLSHSGNGPAEIPENEAQEESTEAEEPREH
jgi:hypothetical protein